MVCASAKNVTQIYLQLWQALMTRAWYDKYKLDKIQKSVTNGKGGVKISSRFWSVWKRKVLVSCSGHGATKSVPQM